MNSRKPRSDKGTFRSSDKTQPDRVFTFKLSPDNPDERAVIDFLDSQKRRGVSLREEIYTAVLVHMNDGQPLPEPEPVQLDGLLDKLRSIVDNLLSGAITTGKQSAKVKKAGVDIDYLKNLQRAMKGDDE